MNFLKNKLSLILALAFCQTVYASSHREAPLISNDPLADNTDLYAFVSPDDPNTVTLIACYVPAQLPHGGPNYYSFGEDIRYEVHIDNDVAIAGDEIVYRFTFTQTNQDPTTFFNIRLGAQNQLTTYICERTTDGGANWQTIVSNGVVPPNNIGNRSIMGGAGLNTTYETLFTNAITTAVTGEQIFCGPTDDPFFVDLGGVFDLGDLPRQGGAPRDGLACKNVSSIAIQVPISVLQKDGLNVNQAANILDGNFTIGVWASASRRMMRTLNNNGTVTNAGAYVQVSRLGMPLTNEVLIPIGNKDLWNSMTPYDDLAALGTYGNYFYNPELGLYMDASLFGGAVPAMTPLRIQRNSLQAFDFGNTHDGLFPLKGSPAVAGTALDDAIFGTLLLPGPGSPRSVDLWPIFHTGVPNLAPYHLATGKGGNPLANGKPFINNFLPNGGDMLRLNMAVPVTQRNDPNFNRMGIVAAAVSGLLDPAYNTNTNIEFIPNMDGFPNGRRLEDDVTNIELQAVAGVALAAIGLWYDDYTAGGPNPVTPDLLNVVTYGTGVDANDAPFRATFPYLHTPWLGTGACSGKAYTYIQPAILPPTWVAAPPCPVVANVVYVNDNAPGLGTGGSWDNAYATLQQALTFATAGDQIWVAEGTYYPTAGVDRNATFALKAGVSVYGGFPDNGACDFDTRDADLYVTTLSGDIGVQGSNADNSYRVVTAYNIGSGVTFDGFTVTGGNAMNHAGGLYVHANGNTSSLNVVNCVFNGNQGAIRAGGAFVYALNSGTTNTSFMGCDFISNNAPEGAGLATLTSGVGTVTLTLDSCNFAMNQGGRGGGLASSTGLNGSTTVTANDCSFMQNNVTTNGAGIWNYARQGAPSNVTLNNATFTGNTAQNGAAIYNLSQSGAGSVTAMNASFTGNISSNYGAVCNYGQTGGTAMVNIQHSMFTGNSGNSGGGLANVAVNGGMSSAMVSASQFQQNTGQGAGIFNYATGVGANASTNATNSVFFGNSTTLNGGAISNSSGASGVANTNILHSTVAGNHAGGLGGAVSNTAGTGAPISTVTAENSIFWANTTQALSGKPFYTKSAAATTTINNCTLAFPTCAGNNSGTGVFNCLSFNAMDPLFVNAGGGDYHLMANSPAIDAGNVVALTEDYDGLLRPSGNGYDLGAFEYQGPRPLARMVQSFMETFNATVFPTPTTGQFTLQLSKESEGVAIVTDFTGRVIETRRVSAATSIVFDLSRHANGIYSVTFSGNEGVFTARVVLSKP